MTSISERLLNAIQESGLSYGDISEKTGIAKSAIQRYAVGATKKIPIDRLQLIASVIGVSSAWLLGWIDEPYPEHIKPAQLSEPKNEEIIELFESLPDDLQRSVLDLLRSLAAKHKHSDAPQE